ncbi:aldehyde dehydrogenase family protein [Rhizobium subbaraonis]|uniref:Aldehyde dehydrogenase family protein n=1 Tax=Rhizobium subbaraonis TaxID=908946 RepID=A0A285UVN7_9HYPH|nr:aldehyde dehydrogenase family protein [Rhizobium subbaraonis]
MHYRSQLYVSGHVVAVTGGANGIGLETPKAFASCGADIALLDIGKTALATAATEDTISEIAMGDAKHVDRVVTAAKAASRSYSMTMPAERRRLLQRCLEFYNETHDEIGALMTEEKGTTASFSQTAQARVAAFISKPSSMCRKPILSNT